MFLNRWLSFRIVSSENENPFKNVEFKETDEQLTIFVEEYNEGGNLKGIYIKEKLKNDESKIIIANKKITFYKSRYSKF